ncbi:MAG: ribulose-phosphate 3-epimerase [Planctomycetaceae bacterium]|nr:ribulose-phosphate 3-epimerase [Planctomycetaceae bacterium]
MASLLTKRPLIAPSMLKCDFANLRAEIERLEQAAAPLLHWDVMDGHFVPNLSYGPPVLERLRDCTELPFDAHLMISDPAKYLKDYVNAGCDAITIHIEAVPEPGELLESIRAAGCSPGLSLNPHTPFEAIEAYLPACDLVLVMSVQPGFGGQKFMGDVLGKVSRIKELMREDQLLSIDGGIGLGTIGQSAQAGADTFVCGSSIFDQTDYSEAIGSLLAEIRGVSC